MGPGWSLLPPELLKAMAEKVTSLADYIRFGAVCRPWLSACSRRRATSLLNSHGWCCLINLMICDFTYNNGFLYTVDRKRPIKMYNLKKPSRTLLGGDINLINMHLVEGVSGDILLIYDGPIHVNGVFKESKYTVYKLNKDGELKCNEVMDVGQNVLFVDGGYRALSLSSANLSLPGWGANCLCYDSVRLEKRNGQATLYNHNIKFARLDDGKVIDITGDLGSFQVNEDWQKSLWLTPSLL